MPTHTTYLTSEAMPEPGELRRVVSVHAGNRSYETVPVGHEPGWLVADPASTNVAYWTDGEVDHVQDGFAWKGGARTYVLSRHGALPAPAPTPPLEPVPPARRRGRFVAQSATPTEVSDKLAEALGEDEDDA